MSSWIKRFDYAVRQSKVSLLETVEGMIDQRAKQTENWYLKLYNSDIYRTQVEDKLRRLIIV